MSLQVNIPSVLRCCLKGIWFINIQIHLRVGQILYCIWVGAVYTGVAFHISAIQFTSRLETELFARSYQQSDRICLCVTVTQHFCSVILKSLDLRHFNDDSNIN